MSKRFLTAATVALSLGSIGPAFAQGTTGAPGTTGGAAGSPATAPTTPPERMNGSTTTNNPATAATPAPGAAMSSTPDSTSGPANRAVNTSSENQSGSPVPGANSFTEGQARSRIEDRGFSEVSELKLDGQGVWRAKAMKDGKSVTIALDYQGNVVAQ